jgi:hypothetical protein
VRAWLEGDWSVVEGAFFDGWSGRNIVRPFRVPREWARFRSFDWGSAKPFSVGWWAVAGEAFEAESAAGPVRIGRGTLVRYAEWYGARGPDKGLKLTAEQVAEGIASREAAMAEDGRPAGVRGVADPSIFREDGGPSIAERMARAGVSWRPRTTAAWRAAAADQAAGRRPARRLGPDARAHRRRRGGPGPGGVRHLPRLHPHRAGAAARPGAAGGRGYAERGPRGGRVPVRVHEPADGAAGG